MSDQDPLASDFQIEMEYPQQVREAIRTHSRQALSRTPPGSLQDLFVLHADEAWIEFHLNAVPAGGEQSGMVFYMVWQLVGGVPDLLAGRAVFAHGWYGSIGFLPGDTRRRVYMLRGLHAADYEFEEELRRELGEPEPDLKETAVAEPPGPGKALASRQWRRFENPISMQAFVEQCLSAAHEVIAVYREECPPEVLEDRNMRGLIAAARDTREAWEQFCRNAGAL